MAKEQYYVVYQFEIYNPTTRSMEQRILRSYIDVEPDIKTNGELIKKFEEELKIEHMGYYNPPANIVIINFYNMNTK